MKNKKQETVINDKSLYLFAADSKIRKFIVEVSNSNKFENFILLTIVASSVALTFESPLNSEEGL